VPTDGRLAVRQPRLALRTQLSDSSATPPLATLRLPSTASLKPRFPGAEGEKPRRTAAAVMRVVMQAGSPIPSVPRVACFRGMSPGLSDILSVPTRLDAGEQQPQPQARLSFRPSCLSTVQASPSLSMTPAAATASADAGRRLRLTAAGAETLEIQLFRQPSSMPLRHDQDCRGVIVALGTASALELLPAFGLGTLRPLGAHTRLATTPSVLVALPSFRRTPSGLLQRAISRGRSSRKTSSESLRKL